MTQFTLNKVQVDHDVDVALRSLQRGSDFMDMLRHLICCRIIIIIIIIISQSCIT